MRKLPRWLRAVGLRKPRWEKKGFFPAGYGEDDKATYIEAHPFTMTDRRKILSLIHAVKYIEKCKVPGEIVECGVWKGGSMMAVARTLLNLGARERALYLFDTFEGMTEPSERDVDPDEIHARGIFEEKRFRDRDGSDWCYSPLDEVKRNVGSIGYPEEKVRYIKGKVEDTLPAEAPESIALLRLDTDWYESTRHEMEHLYPRLVPGGVLLVDDYFHWRGSREAVDEYFAKHGVALFLAPVSGGACVGVKQRG